MPTLTEAMKEIGAKPEPKRQSEAVMKFMLRSIGLREVPING